MWVDVEIAAEDRVRPDVVPGEPAPGKGRLDDAFRRGITVRTRKGSKHGSLSSSSPSRLPTGAGWQSRRGARRARRQLKDR